MPAQEHRVRWRFRARTKAAARLISAGHSAIAVPVHARALVRATQQLKGPATVLHQTYQPAGPDIVHEKFDGDLVVLNLGTGQYFGFNATAAALWEGLMAGVDPARFDVTGLSEVEIGAFVGRLTDLGLIVPAPAAPEGDLPDAIRLLIGSTPVAPAVESYDDLADLIIADPIHDVDVEMGWPHGIKAE